MPVSEEPPLANARASTKTTARVSRPEPGWPLQPLQNVPAVRCALGRPVVTWRNRPTTIMRPTDPENMYVGSANVRPASRIPRRFP